MLAGCFIVIWKFYGRIYTADPQTKRKVTVCFKGLCALWVYKTAEEEGPCTFAHTMFLSWTTRLHQACLYDPPPVRNSSWCSISEAHTWVTVFAVFPSAALQHSHLSLPQNSHWLRFPKTPCLTVRWQTSTHWASNKNSTHACTRPEVWNFHRITLPWFSLWFKAVNQTLPQCLSPAPLLPNQCFCIRLSLCNRVVLLQ